MSHTVRIRIISLAVAGAALVMGSTAFAATDCFWARDAAGKHVRDSAGQCVKSGLWNSSVPTPAACGGMKAEAAKPMPKPAPVTEMITLGAAALFDTNKSEIKPQGRAELDTLATRLRNAKGYERIYVTGHTDSRGDKAYNQRLSEDRAVAVKKYLMSKGVDGNRIVTRGMGETQPVGSNDTDAGRAANRRVDIEIRGFDK